MPYLMFDRKLACQRGHCIHPSANASKDVPFFEACLGATGQTERGSGVPVDPCSKNTSDRRPPAHWARPRNAGPSKTLNAISCFNRAFIFREAKDYHFG